MLFVTHFKAIDTTDGELKRWGGTTITAESFEQAEEICRNLFPYLEVIGELVSEGYKEITDIQQETDEPKPNASGYV
ncbi:hypothetical protein [Massilibacteroides sp.]|uniref:hypothetical protein n=1 Tax=Massilibacteroides sp. TaxID=2034766 RepID=UPI002634B69E|nr:hypothetical protein [Massilibacteroides sp.]MDD4515653.1 hypothetical protein [Massilibacteroides sp.]